METKFAAFVSAQDEIYEQVLDELRAGRKQSHWMWFIFPQFAGLGASAMSQRFAIGSLAEARDYLGHPLLGARLRDCTRLMLVIPSGDIGSILGYPDDLKFHSSMTLFAAADPNEPLFGQALDRFFAGRRDAKTVAMLHRS